MENQLNGGKETLAKVAGSMVDEATDALKTFGTRKVERAKAALAEAQAVVAREAREYGDSTDDYVHANAWKVLGVGAAVGLLVGFLVARR
jgi:ElaB/YqjD/DUF883 family membrane-anchored ribosome-binding protein